MEKQSVNDQLNLAASLNSSTRQSAGNSADSELIYDELDNAIGHKVLTEAPKLQRGDVEVLYPKPLHIYVALHFGGKVSSVLFRRLGSQGTHQFQERTWATLTAAQRVMVARGAV